MTPPPYLADLPVDPCVLRAFVQHADASGVPIDTLLEDAMLCVLANELADDLHLSDGDPRAFLPA